MKSEIDPKSILDIPDFSDYVREGYFFYISAKGKAVAFYDPKKLEKKPFSSLSGIEATLLEKKVFLKLLEKRFSERSIREAADSLCLKEKISAKTINYRLVIGCFLLVFCLFAAFFGTILYKVNNLCFFVQNCFKFLLFNKAASRISSLCNKGQEVKKEKSGQNSELLPLYTILIPLYREKALLGSVLNAIAELNYPKDKLDAKLVIEADDNELIEAIDLLKIPDYVHIVKVPPSFPRTKPKALNYAVRYALGEYIVVYDAEDLPDPDQLLQSLDLFEQKGSNYSCLQARLNFYNRTENILTRLFAVEYGIWFGYLIAGLSLMNLPVPLGGTSNHFKSSALREVHYWDAYNVTEDADLGLRLYCAGYKVAMLDSCTMEESPLTIGNWMNQRSRWIKGFIQTFCVFLRKKETFKNLNLRQFLSVWTFLGLSVYNFFSLPWTLCSIALGDGTIFLRALFLINIFFAMAYAYYSAYRVLTEQENKKSLLDFNLIILLIWPFYFFLHSIACYKAIFEICTSPFRWNKTDHGITKKQK